MRFLRLVLAAAAIGALSVAAAMVMLPQQSASMLAAVHAFAADAAHFRLSHLNPIRAIYDDVKQKITSGEPRIDFPSRPVVVGTPKPFVIDAPTISPGRGTEPAFRIDQYGRNPCAGTVGRPTDAGTIRAGASIGARSRLRTRFTSPLPPAPPGRAAPGWR